MFVESQKKIIRWLAIYCAESIDPFDCLNEYPFVELIWLVMLRIVAFLDSNVEHETAEFSDLVEQAVCECSQFRVPVYVGCRIKTGPLFLPPGRNFSRLFNLEIEQFAFALKKPCPEPTYFIGWKYEAGKAKHGAVVVCRVASTDVRSDMSKFIKIGDVSQ